MLSREFCEKGVVVMSQKGGVIYLNWGEDFRKAFAELFQDMYPNVSLETACTTSGRNADEPNVYVLQGVGSRRSLNVLLTTGSEAQIIVVAEKPRGTRRNRNVTWLDPNIRIPTLMKRVGKKL